MYNGTLLLPRLPKSFPREMLLSHSHLDDRCHLGKIMNKPVISNAIFDLYTPTSLPCRMVLLGTFPTFFLGEVLFFFSGLEAGPTYRPPVRHSNPDTPLDILGDRSQMTLPRWRRVTGGRLMPRRREVTYNVFQAQARTQG